MIDNKIQDTLDESVVTLSEVALQFYLLIILKILAFHRSQ